MKNFIYTAIIICIVIIDFFNFSTTVYREFYAKKWLFVNDAAKEKKIAKLFLT
jgi:hypothetical protein